MDILILDIKGRFAHFRKFYTNSSSLSYSTPPRTAICGMLAAMLGLERDSYYEMFSREKVNIAVRKLNATRKIMETVNYIKADNPKKLLVPKEHTQIPFEIVTGADGPVKYRIYINAEKNIIDELCERAKLERCVYPLYLGAAPFNCTLKFRALAEGNAKKEDGSVKIASLIKHDEIEESGIKISDQNLFLVKEKMPVSFMHGRVLQMAESYIFDENGNGIYVKLKNGFINLKYENTDENIMFM